MILEKRPQTRNLPVDRPRLQLVFLQTGQPAPDEGMRDLVQLQAAEGLVEIIEEVEQIGAIGRYRMGRISLLELEVIEKRLYINGAKK